MKKFFLISLFLAAALLGSCGEEEGYTVQVLLTEGEGYSVVGENPITLPAGEDAVFTVELDAGYHFVQSDGGVWADGTLTVPAVYYPATVNMIASDSAEKVRFFVERDGEGGGRVTCSEEEYLLYPGAMVEVSATPLEGSYFAGWTVNRTLANGGELYSTEQRIQFEVPDSRTMLYANFYPVETEAAPPAGGENLDGPTKNYGKYGVQGNESTHMIAYHANGGRVVGYDSEVFYDEVSTAWFSLPNTLPDQGYFTRPGHILLEYNTKPDGSGTAIPCGGKHLPEGDMSALYCIWMPYTDPAKFTYETKDGGLIITGYTGDDETLVIPEYIGNLPVVRIKKGAVSSDDYTTLIIPKSVKTVDKGAFTSSKNLVTLYLFDSIKTIYDESFSDLSAWKQLRLGAVQDPRYSLQTDTNLCRQWEKLRNTAKAEAAGEDIKKLVVCSGSSSFHGLSTPTLQNGLDGDYTVINYGNMAGSQVTFFMDAISDFLDDNDTIVHAPETAYDGAMGSTDFYLYIFRMIEYSYDMLYYVDDIGMYYNVLNRLREFNANRAKLEAKDYDMFVYTVDENGDHTGERKNNGNSSKYYGKAIDLTVINEAWIENLNYMYNHVMEKSGCKVLLSFAPFNYNALTLPSRTEAGRNGFMERITELVDIPVISHIWDYMQTGDLMYNSDYHPADEGRELRSKQLAADLNAYFKKEAEK